MQHLCHRGSDKGPGCDLLHLAAPPKISSTGALCTRSSRHLWRGAEGTHGSDAPAGEDRVLCLLFPLRLFSQPTADVWGARLKHGPRLFSPHELRGGHGRGCALIWGLLLPRGGLWGPSTVLPCAAVASNPQLLRVPSSAPAESHPPEQLPAFSPCVPACSGGSPGSRQLGAAPGRVPASASSLRVAPGLSRAAPEGRRAKLSPGGRDRAPVKC